MKRCPQCEFIYEDDQSLCDMDGVLLVFDSRTLPNMHALATVSGPIPDKTQRRSRMVPAFATLLLMLVIASVYYVTSLRKTAVENFSPVPVTTSTSAASEPPVQPPAEAPAAIPEPTPAAEEKPETRPETRPTTAPKPAAVPAKKATTEPAAARSPEPPKKDDSKVGSILKKTGNILKKPFKF